MENKTKVVVLAAGQGTRLRPFTNLVPKTMVKLAGTPILKRQLDLYNESGLTNLNVIVGYKKDVISFPEFLKIENPKYETTNMVSSLHCGKDLFDGSGDVVVAYGDIVFEPIVLKKLLEAPIHDIGVVIDMGWRKLWEQRMEDPLSDAETLKLNNFGHITELGKKPKSFEDIKGQYIGLFKVSKEFAPAFFELYESLDQGAVYDGKDYPNMYMTTYLQLLIDKGIKLESVKIDNGWIEVDSVEDLNHYEVMAESGQLDEICKLSVTKNGISEVQ